MTDDTLLPFDLPAACRKKLTVDFNGGSQSSDAGLLLLREAERKFGVCRRLATAMLDRRDPRPAPYFTIHALCERGKLGAQWLAIKLAVRDSPTIGNDGVRT